LREHLPDISSCEWPALASGSESRIFQRKYKNRRTWRLAKRGSSTSEGVIGQAGLLLSFLIMFYYIKLSSRSQFSGFIGVIE